MKISLRKQEEGNEKLINMETSSHNGIALSPSSSACVLNEHNLHRLKKGLPGLKMIEKDS